MPCGTPPIDGVTAVESVAIGAPIIAIDRRRRRIRVGRDGVAVGRVDVSRVSIGRISICVGPISATIIAVAAIAISISRTDGVAGNCTNHAADDGRDDFIVVIVMMVTAIVAICLCRCRC
jgi:hypothetical protein